MSINHFEPALFIFLLGFDLGDLVMSTTELCLELALEAWRVVVEVEGGRN